MGIEVEKVKYREKKGNLFLFRVLCLDRAPTC